MKSKNLSRVLSCFFVGYFLCATAPAQTEKNAVSPMLKVGLINTEAFHDKQTGIGEIIELDGKLEVEFKPQSDELKLLVERIQELEKEFKDYQEAEKKFRNAYFLHCDTSITKKFDEYDKLVKEYKQKETQATELYYKRKAEVFAAVDKKVAEALRRFIKEKGYAMIFDVSKLKEGVILVKPEPGDVTEEFIRFYNENFAKTD